MMMKLCDLNTAKTLQELGYDGEYAHCHVGVYPKNEYQIMTLTDCEKYRRDITILCAAPRLDDVAYWLRDEKKIFLEISYDNGFGRPPYYVEIKILPEGDYIDDISYHMAHTSYEAAAEAGIQAACKYLIDKDTSPQNISQALNRYGV